MSFTRARWVAFRQSGVIEVQAEGARCPIVGWPGFDDSFRATAEHWANARLIAAAGNAATEVEKHGYDGMAAIVALPRLIEACEYALRQIEGIEEVFDYLDLELRAALGLARGSVVCDGRLGEASLPKTSLRGR